ncbi:MAG: DUF1987 domain-containing protein [Crocinitomicaceae bacterium]|nr:DUF1987 domain-containing protein [Crocinitomicaceae bacterium]
MDYKYETTLIHSTRKTPEIELNVEEGRIKIHGISIPENSKVFYDPLLNWVGDYLRNPKPETTLIIALRYMNSSTTMIINKILKALDQGIKTPNTLIFEWHYEEEDLEMYDVGQYYQELLQTNVVFKEVEEI